MLKALRIDGFMATMLVAVALAVAWPHVGAAGGPIPFGAITTAGIALVFFLHGAGLSPEALHAGAANWRLHAVVQGSTFLLFPALGAAIYFGGDGVLSPSTRLGLFFLAAVCSTISSSVALVAVARGNVAAAIFDASLSGLLGIVLTPLIVGLVHSAGPAAGPSPLRSVLVIAVQLLLPFALGQLARPLLARPLKTWKPWVTRLDRGVIVLIVYTAFCQSTADGLWSTLRPLDLLGVLALVGALLALVLVATTAASRRLGFSTEDEITAVFCGSKKSLANGAPIAKVLFGASGTLGAVLLPLMLYHQLQIVVCSVLARRYARRADTSIL